MKNPIYTGKKLTKFQAVPLRYSEDRRHKEIDKAVNVHTVKKVKQQKKHTEIRLILDITLQRMYKETE